MATTVAEKVIRIDVVTSAGAQRAIQALASDIKKVEGSTAQMQRSLNAGFGSLQQTFGRIGGFLDWAKANGDQSPKPQLADVICKEAADV